MRIVFTAAILIMLPSLAAKAAPITSASEAVADARSDGYAKIALTEHRSQEWDIWATKDGLCYELKIDARTGALLQTIPLDSDD